MAAGWFSGPVRWLLGRLGSRPAEPVAPVRRFTCNGRGTFGFTANGGAPGFVCNGRGTPNRFACNEAPR